MKPEAKALATGNTRRVGDEALTVTSVGDAVITHEVMEPGWRGGRRT